MTKDEQNLLSKIYELIGTNKINTFEAVPPTSISFSALLENYVHFDFTEKEAIQHWKNILKRFEELKSKIADEANVHMAIVDYFTNAKHILDQPMLVEVHVFRQTEQAAMIDGLTNLFNRRYMDIILKKEFYRCKRYNKKLTLCIMDIDNFKKVNDTYGHQFGDLVLKTLADCIKKCLREEDVACRYGGEEFLLILPETDAAGAYTLCERIRTVLKSVSPFKEKSITFSAGTASFPETSDDFQTLVRLADKALYEAKFTGKNKTVKAKLEDI